MVLRALLVTAVVLAGCAIEPRYRVYGADLETRENSRAFFWPADATGERFRYVAESGRAGTGDVRSLTLEPGAELQLEPPLTGATVVLPEGASAALRAAAQALLDALAERYPGLSTHLVASAVPWDDVTTAGELAARAQEARDRVAPEPSWSTVFGDLLLASTPRLVAVPRAGGDGFLLAAARERLTLSSEPPVGMDYLEASAGAVVDRTRAADGERAMPYRWLVLLVPHDAGPACRRRCDALLAELGRSADPSWALVRRTTRVVNAAELTGPDALRAALPRMAAEPYQ